MGVGVCAPNSVTDLLNKLILDLLVYIFNLTNFALLSFVCYQLISFISNCIKSLNIVVWNQNHTVVVLQCHIVSKFIVPKFVFVFCGSMDICGFVWLSMDPPNVTKRIYVL